MKCIYKYANATSYEEEQIALKEIAKINNLSIHQTRGRLVILGIYHNKEKGGTRILKSHYVDKLVDKLDTLNDTEIEYLERLTIPLLKKILEKL